jgi:hypothetical protein
MENVAANSTKELLRSIGEMSCSRASSAGRHLSFQSPAHSVTSLPQFK